MAISREVYERSTNGTSITNYDSEGKLISKIQIAGQYTYEQMINIPLPKEE